MAKRPLRIVGAGLSGLTLGRCLLKRGIPAVLYERKPSAVQHGYGITLYASTYEPLLKALDVDELTFKKKVAVDTEIGGSGKINDAASSTTESWFRANRGRLENWLSEGLDVRWEHELHKVERPEDDSNSSTLHFKNNQQVKSDVVVAADGPHSSLRKSVLPESKLTILPFVSYNGKQRLKRTDFDTNILPHMNSSNIINFTHGDARLNLSINDYTPERAAVSWTYSRPSRGPRDELHQPERPLSCSTTVPKAIFEEMDNFKSSLPEPFAHLFDAKQVKECRILHWLQRSILVPREDLRELAKGGIMLMGDAAHAQPIVGGNGANEAIADAVSLAERIANGPEGLDAWIDERYSSWESSVTAAQYNIESLHKTTSERL